MTKTSKIIYFFVSVVFFIVFDIFFSNMMLESLETFPENPLLDLIFVQNTGAAFNILQNSKIFLICFALGAIVWIIFYTLRHIEKASAFSLFWIALLTSGVFCNMYERISLGYVRDFFKLNFVNFPVFNISDIFINVSVFAIVVIIIKHNFKKSNETGN